MDRFSNIPSSGYRVLVDHFPNGVLVLFDSELRYQIVGPETLPFSKREASGMIGKDIHELFPEETATQLEPKLQATIAGESRSFHMEYDGRIHQIETEPVQIEGEQYGILVSQDRTEERQAAQQLKRQNRRLDKFANMVSHDLRNPLNVAQGRLEMAREECDTDHHEAIATALDRMQRIIEDVLWLAREGRDIGTVEPVSLIEAIDSAWSMVTAEADNAELHCQDSSNSLPTINADYDRLRQLLENIFRNAIEHGGDDVSVCVGLLPDGFYIEDDGPGIPTEKRDEAFEAGYTTAEDGTGFGLNIVDQVIEAHGWDIRVTEGSSGGARFEITGLEFLA